MSIEFAINSKVYKFYDIVNQVIDIGDVVKIIHLKKHRLPTEHHSKLTDKKNWSFFYFSQVGSKCLYHDDLPPTIKISFTFNVSDFYPYHPPDQFQMA